MAKRRKRVRKVYSGGKAVKSFLLVFLLWLFIGMILTGQRVECDDDDDDGNGNGNGGDNGNGPPSPPGETVFCELDYMRGHYLEYKPDLDVFEKKLCRHTANISPSRGLNVISDDTTIPASPNVFYITRTSNPLRDSLVKWRDFQGSFPEPKMFVYVCGVRRIHLIVEGDTKDIEGAAIYEKYKPLDS